MICVIGICDGLFSESFSSVLLIQKSSFDHAPIYWLQPVNKIYLYYNTDSNATVVSHKREYSLINYFARKYILHENKNNTKICPQYTKVTGRKVCSTRFKPRLKNCSIKFPSKDIVTHASMPPTSYLHIVSRHSSLKTIGLAKIVIW